ncbi:DUF4270 domain-containing protein [Flavobacterium luminosum]|uniref:DUF4270 domain-containing protein n=1 Tax=Flavobacterium luminosum TaxID=2949086 RepID=A0ABT0TQ42_9FLAO|nr:DUF4270 domain-containing protein [Flavobacterium sp. HXWNR70]MCL9809604.1 DUF4270 domain-containing protein [Flavobacterium sp. HXWNR70]
MRDSIFTKYIVIALFSVLFVSCDKDFNTLGGDIIGDENYDFLGDPFTVKAYNQKVPVIQTNNLPLNQLGITNNPVFGKTVANFATQLTLSSTSPDFDQTKNIVIDSVVLNVPYFNKKVRTLSSGIVKYKLDSVYTTDVNDTIYKPINLKIFRSGYQLNDVDPDNLEVSNKYYSNQDANFSTNVVGAQLNDDFAKPSQNSAFKPSNREYVNYKVKSTKEETGTNYFTMKHERTTEVESRGVPAMRINLNKDYFKQHIIEANPSNLANNNIFKSYFKGLYFQVEDANEGSMMSLDFSKGNITIYYTEDEIVTETKNNTTTAIGNNRPLKEFVLNMSGVTVNLLNNTDNPSYLSAVDNPDRTSGDDNLYLKGGEGSMAYIELFTPQELNTLKADKDKILLNDASLYFTVNRDIMTSKYEPLRVYLFDVDNNKVLYDYSFDVTDNGSFPKLSKYIFGGILETKKDNDVVTEKTYRIRITEHVNRIIKGEQENVRLGLVVTENIGYSGHVKLKSPTAVTNLKTLPVSSVVNPLGTVLYGTGANAGNKNVKFKIYYTKPN